MSTASTTILQQIIHKSKKIVFFGGAGVSTESGIPDFRSVDGLYNQQWKYPPEQIISRTFFYNNPPEFYRFYRAKLLPQGIKPNPAHYKLAELEAAGKLIAVVTQNIDGLHQMAGSKNVLNYTEALCVITVLTVMNFMMKRLSSKVRTLRINFRTVKNAAAL